MSVLNAKVTAAGLTLERASKHRTGCVPAGSGPEKIPFKNVLWIEKTASPGVFSLSYARQLKPFHYAPTTVTVALRDPENVEARVLEEAYQDAKPRKRLLVLINPHGGQGRAEAIYRRHCAPMLAAAQCAATVVKTTHRLHAREIAETLDIARYDAIVCCSGDGIPHEVVNGFARRPDAAAALRVPLCQLPCGSGNSMAVSLNGTPHPGEAALNIVKGRPMPIDLMSLSQGEKHGTLSFLSQTYGVIADADLGTEALRWMGGTRFVVGTVQRILARSAYPCEVYVKYAQQAKEDVARLYKSQSRRTDPKAELQASPEPELGDRPDPLTTRFGTVHDAVPEDWVRLECPHLAVFYAGKMPWVSADALMFPATLPCDGMLDLVMFDNTLGRLRALDLLTKVERGEHFHLDHIQYSKVEAYRLVPKIPAGFLSIDGESFPFEPFQVEVLRGAGSLLSATGAYAPTNLHHDHPANRSLC